MGLPHDIFLKIPSEPTTLSVEGWIGIVSSCFPPVKQGARAASYYGQRPCQPVCCIWRLHEFEVLWSGKNVYVSLCACFYTKYMNTCTPYTYMQTCHISVSVTLYRNIETKCVWTCKSHVPVHRNDVATAPSILQMADASCALVQPHASAQHCKFHHMS